MQALTYEWSDQNLVIPMREIPAWLIETSPAPVAIPSSRSKRSINPRTLEMCEMRISGMKFREIAAQLGVTFQAVEQAVRRAATRDPEIAARLRTVEEKPAAPPKALKFKARMFYWLRWAGFRYCWCCQTVLDDDGFSPKARICRKCNAAKASELYRKSAVVRENVRRHNRIHGKKYNQRYIQKLKREDPERLREVRRRAYLSRKAKMQAITVQAAAAGAS